MKLEEILKTVSWKEPLTDEELETAINCGMFSKERIILYLEAFGKQCFFAAKYGEFVSLGGTTIEFETFEDYLKELK